MNKPLIYLASPHSHIDSFVREIRYQLAKRAWYHFFMQGHLVFSPILHTHEVAKDYVGVKGFEFYQKLDEKMIDVCDEVWVLCIDGWRGSKGVQSEIKYAHESHKPIRYFEYEYSEVLDNKNLAFFKPYIILYPKEVSVERV